MKRIICCSYPILFTKKLVSHSDKDILKGNMILHNISDCDKSSPSRFGKAVFNRKDLPEQKMYSKKSMQEMG